MAIIECPECGKEISSHAENCPHCGYPINKKTPVYHHSDAPEREYNYRTISSFISAGVILIIGICFIVSGLVQKKVPAGPFVGMGIFMIVMSVVGVLIGIYRWHQTH